MPIISFNISDNLKKFLKKMVQPGGEYKNNSYVMRDALIRLMQEKDGALASESDLPVTIAIPKITSSVLITYSAENAKLEKKIAHLEFEYHDNILQKSILAYNGLKTITYILEAEMDNIQIFITELNSLEELQSFRYIINEPENDSE
jgi:Arc/MetJ-type ribon-helix-helix transcriptional regulator